MRIGIDLGGTKIEAIALGDDGQELLRKRTATPRDYEGTVTCLVDLIRDIEQQTGQTGTVGIGIPGAISPHTGLVKNANSTWLIGKPLKQDLAAQLSREIRIENDANCFIVSEATDGTARGAHIAFGVIVGTGTGGGIAIDKIPLTGANAIGGEWGHNPLPWPDETELPGAKCFCGQRGCIETFLSGPGFSRDFREHGGHAESARGIIKKAEQGDALALKAIEQYEQRMAKALASVINIIDPEIIVLGGGMSNIQRLYQNVPKIWGQYVFSDHVSTQLLPPQHGDSSGVRGAAWLWPNK